MDDDKVLLLFPRSGLGFKYRLQLDNTVGVIDADYYGNDKNGGHIGAKLTCDSKQPKTVTIRAGEAYMQGVFVQFFKTDDDDADGERHGGFGSTTNALFPKNRA
jgi:dUTP pyrophosphatase